MTLTKADLVQHIYKTQQNITRKQAKHAVEMFLSLSKSSLINGENLRLKGFGKFKVRDKGPRKGRNPHTGDEMLLPSRRVVTFSPSVKLRQEINGE